MIRFLQVSQILILSLVFSLAGNSRAAGEPSSITEMEYQPVLIFESDEVIDQELKVKVLQIVLDSFRKSILGSIGHTLYGSGPNFRPRRRRGPLYEYLRAFEEIDRMLEKRANGDLRETLRQIPEGKISTFAFHLMWTKNRQGMGSISENLPGSQMFNLLWSMIRLRMIDKERSPSFGDALSWALRIPLIDARDLPGGMAGLNKQGLETYRFFARRNHDRMVPLISTFELKLSHRKVAVDMRAIIKPKNLKVRLSIPEPADMILAEYIHWEPPQHSANPPVARFVIKRSYGENADVNSRPELTATFGRIKGSDLRDIIICQESCDAVNRETPFHLRKSSPTVVGNLRVPTDGSRGTLYKIKRKIVEAVNEHMDLFVMLSDLKFDISRPNEPILIEDKSRVPLVLRFITPFTGGKHYLDITKKDRFGLNYMDQIVNSKAAYKIGKGIRNTMTSVDSKLNRETREVINKLFEAML